jgi:hypothetical protein
MKRKLARTALPVALVSLLAVSNAQAALVTNIGQVTDLRVEGTYGFIGMGQSTGSCGSRYWIDMSTDLGRSIYATAMMAFSTERNVYLRADDTGTRVFGECPLYDILVTR